MYQPIKRTFKQTEYGHVSYTSACAFPYSATLQTEIRGVPCLYCFNAQDAVHAYHKIKRFEWVVSGNHFPAADYDFEVRFSVFGLYIMATDK